MSVQYLLTNVTFDNSYKNMPYFNNELLRNNAIIGDKEFTSSTHNFNYGDMLHTSFIVNDYHNENYFIVNKGIGDYKFYFITKSEYKSVNQWLLTLELDVITQYFWGVDNSIISNCYVERGHCNRFKKYSDLEKLVKFDVKEDSPMITREQNIEMITTDRKEPKIKYCNNTEINDWLNLNVKGWVYYYLDFKRAHHFQGATYDGSLISVDDFNENLECATFDVGGSKLTNEYTVIACPIYRVDYNKIYIIDSNHKQSACLDKIGNYRLLNNDNSFIYNIKYSLKPPINFDDIIPYVSFDEMYNMIIRHDATYGFTSYERWNIGNIEIIGNSPIVLGVIGGETSAYRESACIVNVNATPQEFDDIDINMHNIFMSSNLVRGQRNEAYEPKMFVDCQHVVLRDSSNGEWSYPALYFNETTVKPMYDEALNITNTNYYYRLKPTGIIPEQDGNNWHGIVNTVDYSQQIANNNYENFIANNKNFLLTKQVQQVPSVAMLSLGDVSSIGNITNNVYNTMTDINNIKNKPNTMACVNDTVELNLSVNKGIKLYVDIDSPREVDRKKYYDYIYSHGYAINRFCNPCDYIGTRKYFNYLKCDLEGVNILAPDNVINKIRSVFKNGVRLWNEYEDMYNYTMENYERWLENYI